MVLVFGVCEVIFILDENNFVFKGEGWVKSKFFSDSSLKV